MAHNYLVKACFSREVCFQKYTSFCFCVLSVTRAHFVSHIGSSLLLSSV